VLESRELLRWALAHALRGAVRRDQVGVLGLQVAQLTLEAVVFLVRDLRRVQDVIEVLVAPDLLAELPDPLRGPVAGRAAALANGRGRG
jgi:hypothetical protein